MLMMLALVSPQSRLMLMMLASGGGWLLTLLDLWGFLVGCLEMAKTTPQSRAREWGVGFHSKSPDQALGFRIWFSVGLGGKAEGGWFRFEDGKPRRKQQELGEAACEGGRSQCESGVVVAVISVKCWWCPWRFCKGADGRR